MPLIDLSGGLRRLSATQLSLMMSSLRKCSAASGGCSGVNGGATAVWLKLKSHFNKINCLLARRVTGIESITVSKL